jgi:AAA15 family ATPase/GTPase
MIKKLSFNHYRKLKNIELEFSKGINIISGTNGTCKTSILHIISNSFQEPISLPVMTTIRNLNNCTNPKIETLTKGDRKYANPAIGTSGILYSAYYFDDTNLNFRRKNDKTLEEKRKRFRIIPKYSRAAEEKLPSIPIIYLGLSRLVSSGEIDDANFNKKRDTLPLDYHKEIASIYNELAKQQIEISTYKTMQFGNIKTRAEFITTEEGIDSNTISDGQDNLHIIITALVSLKFYYEETNGHNNTGSILLIDEVDATLHPDLQLKLLKLFKKFSDSYNIQIIFTTHSLDLLEEGIKREYYNVIYIDDDIEKVKVIKDDKLDIYNIKSRLYSRSMGELLKDKFIPIYTEDREARMFLEMLLNYFADKYEEFSKIRNYFYLADSYLGYDNLCKLFQDKKCEKQFSNCIGIVDGDVQLDKNSINNNLITLPGKTSVENLSFEFSKKLFDSNTEEFWDDEIVSEAGFTRPYFRDHILEDIKEIKLKLESNPDKKERDLNKACFNKENNNEFFRLVLKYWILSPENEDSLQYFYKGLVILYHKTAELNGINRKLLKEI